MNYYLRLLFICLIATFVIVGATSVFFNTNAATTIAAPGFIASAGSYTAPFELGLRISNNTFYTLDGSTPTCSSTPYTGNIRFVSPGLFTIKAISCTATATSAVVSSTYNILPPLPPAFLVPSGTYVVPFNVVLSNTPANSKIVYTSDGSTPTCSSTQYTQAIRITNVGPTTLKAIVCVNGGSTPSSIAWGNFVGR